MSSPWKRHLLLGLLGASLPLVLQAAFGARVLAWLGGLDGLSRTLGLAGRPSHLLGLLSLGSMVALSFVLSFLTRGRNVPVVVPVVLATVPWLAGLFGALLHAQGVIEFIPSASQEDPRLWLIQGTGELLRMRLLGAGSSTALLLATAGALFLARPAPALELAVDASIPVSQLRRLIDIATGMDLTTLALVGTRVPEAETAKLSETLSGTPPILQQVVTALFGPVPRITRVRLLPVLHSSTFTPVSTWVAELGAEHRLVLSKTPLGSQTLELELSGPASELAHAGGDGSPVLFLTVTEQASLEDVASAVRKCQLQGFTVLLSARPPPISRSP